MSSKKIKTALHLFNKKSKENIHLEKITELTKKLHGCSDLLIQKNKEHVDHLLKIAYLEEKLELKENIIIKLEEAKTLSDTMDADLNEALPISEEEKTIELTECYTALKISNEDHLELLKAYELTLAENVNINAQLEETQNFLLAIKNKMSGDFELAKLSQGVVENIIEDSDKANEEKEIKEATEEAIEEKKNEIVH